MIYFLVGVPLVLAFMSGVLAERWRLVRLIATPFEVAHTCSECGAAMHPPVSHWRCKNDVTHTMNGPEIGFEIRERVSQVRSPKEGA